ncbi:MAG TPA: chromosome segregation protein SMC, partial [Pirellulaceae bacterium]|nr:chromosome segregation protein SMC [Pirellulaceae bacterium]
TTDAELVVARQQHEDVAERLEAAQVRLQSIEALLGSTELAIQATESNVADLDARRQQTMQRLSAEQIELAKNDQRCHGLRAQLEQIDRDEQQRRRSLEAARHQWEQSLERHRQSERQILRASAELATLYLHKERETRDSRELLRRRDELVAERASLNDEMQALRRSSRKIEDERHERQLAVNAVGHERQTLLERMREDYNIDLAAQDGPLSGEQLQEREQVEEEIASLRKRIQGIGSVNLDALAELDELESRYSSLSGQFEDLKQAKESLERIIQKINADSRRLFLETLEKIRVNFQTLYRRAFGGGRADIVLEEGADVLEGGVDILATPPGKPSFSNSLLSGGEKALTAVALLLAIFQFRPSPFCVLDEVDAPFDEANIGRFIDVLKDFLSFTKFVIVTHSKKTMTSATTLYGVTMQESGVSKRVSVQFEDVSEDGHIRREAVDRQSAADASSSVAAA